ncbi:hypothetical protein G9A89_002867 [Geosiphon pyriformis]|nr:hypothetical protein G9A89_002867 [Geosiphon pyriformis]
MATIHNSYKASYHNILGNLLGAALVGAALALTTHSYLRLRILRTNGYRTLSLNILNIATIFNEFIIILFIYANEVLISPFSIPWLNFLINLLSLVSKPTMIYLSYYRASLVNQHFHNHRFLHYSFLFVRTLAIIILIIVNSITDFTCNDITISPRCHTISIIRKFEDLLSPLWRFYYIIAEAIFFYNLLRWLQHINSEKRDTKIIRYIRFQAFLFFFDIVQLNGMSIYRFFSLLKEAEPIYIYLECFSHGFTVYNITQFGISIPSVFRENPNDGIIAPTSFEEEKYQYLAPVENFLAGSFKIFTVEEKVNEDPQYNYNHSIGNTSTTTPKDSRQSSLKSDSENQTKSNTYSDSESSTCHRFYLDRNSVWSTSSDSPILQPPPMIYLRNDENEVNFDTKYDND